MRYFRLYQSDPWYDTSDVSLKRLCKEIFRTEDGNHDGYKKVWKEVVFTWGDEELGGCAEVENSRQETARVKVEAWDKDEGRMLKEEGEFWGWYQLYRYLSSIVCDFSPRFRYNTIYTHNTGIVADFWSFSSSFRREGDMEEEMKNLYKLVSVCYPGLGKIVSDDSGLPFEIYTEADKTLTVEKGVREILTCDNELKQEEVVRIYIPLVSSYEEFVKGYGKELFRILSELDPD